MQYPVVSNITSSLNSGSYIDQTEYNLFYSDSVNDVWFGISNKDSIEISVYDLNNNLINWQFNDNIGTYKNSSLTYYDEKNNALSYNYSEYILNYPIYKSQKILVNPISDISPALNSGNYIIAYQFTRYLAGDPNNTLTIKDISPSKTELKLIPSSTSTPEYDSFCRNKIILKNVSPLYINSLKDCNYTTLYNNSKDKNVDAINLIKSIFFISSDGKFVEFLKYLYEDFIKYTSTEYSSVIRIQGIKTYFNNFLVSNTENIFDFEEIKDNFKNSVTNRLNILFLHYTGDQYKPAKDYLFNLFVNDYFSAIHSTISTGYNEKYNSPLKNALCYGNGEYTPILSTSFIDERQNESDPLTLLVKLQSPLSDNLSIKSSVWVSNISMIPFLFKCVVKNNTNKTTIKISQPNFSLIPENTSFSNTNKSFSSNDLTVDDTTDAYVSINKKINELNVDYTSLNNFIVFSSSELRHNIFKNKMVSLSSISSSISNIDNNYQNSGYTYQYYTSEKENLQSQFNSIIDSFDGFESYLYKTGYYTYNPLNKTFSSSSFVSYMDDYTKEYDKSNRDSLINNTPEHILLDSQNGDYLTFLSMVGHYFDNLYLYIQSIPSNYTSTKNNILAKNIVNQMVESFGWKIDESIGSLNISDNYLDSQLGGNSSISAENRTTQNWNRILTTLPLIYKTKGTEECIKLLLSCYGIPSTALSIREYGGIDYSDIDKTSYTLDEKTFMLMFKGIGEYIKLSFNPLIKTIEFKLSLNNGEKEYIINEKIPLVQKYNESNGIDWTVGVYKESKKYFGRMYFELGSNIILSDSLPIFNGDIFSIMLRKNNPDELFEYDSISDLIPTKYDLNIQKNEDGKIIFASTNSIVLTKTDNQTFSSVGTLYFGNYQNSNGFVGTLDKILIWEDAITDDSYNDHCNDLNSYSYSGSINPYEALYYRMNFEYPLDISGSSIIINSNEYYSSSISASSNNFGVISYSSSIDNCNVVSHSCYPYQFNEINYIQTFSIPSYGPNKFKNQKVKKVNWELSTRLDSDDRSTYIKNGFETQDSNQIGVFINPNDYKNKDIFRYLGNVGISSLIANPDQMFDSEYDSLKNLRLQYNKSGNKRVLYNEMVSLYKFYFDKSLFETIKQLIPSRANVLSGILIEPTVLERPKYQYKPIVSDVSNVEFTSSAVTQSYNVIPESLSVTNTINVATNDNNSSGELIYVDFDLDKDLLSSHLYKHVPYIIPQLPATQQVYQEYLKLQNQLKFVQSGWIKIYPTDKELGHVEQHSDWYVPQSSQHFGPLNLTGIPDGYYLSGSYYYLKNCYFYVYVDESDRKILNSLNNNVNGLLNFNYLNLPTINYPTVVNDGIINDIENEEELGVQCDSVGKIIESRFFNESPRYLIKNWKKDSVYSVVGEYSKPQTVQSNDLYLYTTKVLNESCYSSLVYTSSFNEFVTDEEVNKSIPNVKDYTDIITKIPTGWRFYHIKGTFKHRSNKKTNNVFSTFYPSNPSLNTTIKLDMNDYFEVFSGYSRNHLTHKKITFTNESYPQCINVNDFDKYVKSRQTKDTTIDENGLEDKSLPIQSINVSNINVVKTDNVLK